MVFYFWAKAKSRPSIISFRSEMTIFWARLRWPRAVRARTNLSLTQKVEMLILACFCVFFITNFFIKQKSLALLWVIFVLLIPPVALCKLNVCCKWSFWTWFKIERNSCSFCDFVKGCAFNVLRVEENFFFSGCCSVLDDETESSWILVFDFSSHGVMC